MITNTSERWSVGEAQLRKVIFENPETGEKGLTVHRIVPVEYRCLDGSVDTWEVKMTSRGFLIKYPDSIVESGRGFYRKPEDIKTVHNRESSLSADTLLDKLQAKFGMDKAISICQALIGD